MGLWWLVPGSGWIPALGPPHTPLEMHSSCMAGLNTPPPVFFKEGGGHDQSNHTHPMRVIGMQPIHLPSHGVK